MEELKIGRMTNSELTKEIITDIPGLTYYPNFLTDKQHQQMLDSFEVIDYKIVNGRPTKYFGLEYSHRKMTHDAKQEEIPHFFNLLAPLDFKFDQLVIEYFRTEDGHGYINESELFDNTVIIVNIGSHFKYHFSNENKSLEFLIEPKSLLVISGESRRWKRGIRSRVKEKFNGFIIPRKDFHLMTFRNIKNLEI